MDNLEKQIDAFFDVVVFLTSSDWFTEPRSNRYHYASRFAKILPTIFVQFDADKGEMGFEATEINNLTVLHLDKSFAPPDSTLKFNKKNIISSIEIIKKFAGERVLAWSYNPFCSQFLNALNPVFSVYHATEIYLGPPSKRLLASDDKFYSFLEENVLSLIKENDLVFAVSDGVFESLVQAGIEKEKIIKNYNGVDAHYWFKHSKEVQSQARPVAFYQGNINQRLDFELILGMCKALPHWDFWFCGKESTSSPLWADIINLTNVSNYGYCELVEIAKKAQFATLGLVPFKNSHVLYTSMPLKMYEYVACGLPVVSTPIKDLLHYDKNIFWFAETVVDFKMALEEIYQVGSRANVKSLKQRKKISLLNSYDIKFNLSLREILKKLRFKTESICKNEKSHGGFFQLIVRSLSKLIKK